jgi:sec-independent protein translocase protein TatB
MFEVGFVEIIMISALALIVLGPEKLPYVARQLGRWVGRARAMARQFRDQLEQETTLDDDIMKPKPERTRAPGAPPPSSSAPSAGLAALPTVAAATGEVDAAATASPSSPPPPPEEDESSWYPPDHHAHPEYAHPEVQSSEPTPAAAPKQQSLFEGGSAASTESADANKFAAQR